MTVPVEMECCLISDSEGTQPSEQDEDESWRSHWKLLDHIPTKDKACDLARRSMYWKKIQNVGTSGKMINFNLR